MHDWMVDPDCIWHPMISLNKYNFINEIKIFYQNAQQLEILLDETKSSCRELLPSIQSTIGSFALSAAEDSFIQGLSAKKICFVVLGQNSRAKALIVNEILARPLLPLTEDAEDEFWRIIRIKVKLLFRAVVNLISKIP